MGVTVSQAFFASSCTRSLSAYNLGYRETTKLLIIEFAGASSADISHTARHDGHFFLDVRKLLTIHILQKEWPQHNVTGSHMRHMHILHSSRGINSTGLSQLSLARQFSDKLDLSSSVAISISIALSMLMRRCRRLTARWVGSDLYPHDNEWVNYSGLYIYIYTTNCVINSL